MKKSAILISALLLMGLAPAYAEDGSRLYVRKGCISCHGAGGAAPLGPEYPVLAGQNKDYIVNQISAFAKKHRAGTLTTNQMVPFANSIQKEGSDVVNAIAEYVSGNQNMSSPDYDASLAAKGKEVYANNGCAACHGMDGKSPIAPTYPKLAGLSPQYMSNQLAAFKKGTRGGTPEAMMMAPMAQPLSAADMEAVSNYLASLK